MVAVKPRSKTSRKEKEAVLEGLEQKRKILDQMIVQLQALLDEQKAKEESRPLTRTAGA